MRNNTFIIILFLAVLAYWGYLGDKTRNSKESSDVSKVSKFEELGEFLAILKLCEFEIDDLKVHMLDTVEREFKNRETSETFDKQTVIKYLDGVIESKYEDNKSKLELCENLPYIVRKQKIKYPDNDFWKMTDELVKLR